MNKRLLVFFQITPIFLSLFLVGAHFLRSGSIVLSLLCFFLIMLLFIREPLVARIIQFAMLCTTIEWLHTAYTMISSRIDGGQPWLRLAVILGCVALLSFSSMFLFFTQSLKKMYHLNKENKPLDSSTGPKQKMTQSKTAENNSLKDSTASTDLIKISQKKIIMNALSPAAFVIMDFSIGFGFISLIILGFANNSLRRKMNVAEGELSEQEQKDSFYRQTIGMLAISTAIIVYFYIALPLELMKTIMISIVAGYTVLMGIAAYFDYIKKT